MPTYADFSLGPGTLSHHASQFAATEWAQRGKEFLAAALLLQQQTGNTAVVAHLIGQAIELLGKSYLLWVDPDISEKCIKDIGHDLVKLVDAVAIHLDSRLITDEFRHQVVGLNELFLRHALRYPGVLEFVMAPPTPPNCEPLMRHLYFFLRLAKRLKIWRFIP